MPNPSELNLVEDEGEPDLAPEELGQQFGRTKTRVSRIPQPLQAYRFLLPDSLDDIFATMDTQRGQRIKAQFRGEHALLVLPSTDPLDYTITSAEREYGKRGESKLGSEMAFLLAALGETTIPAFSNSRKLMAKLIKHAGETFRADVDWEVTCDKRREIRRYDEHQKKTVKVTGTYGCGRRYGTRNYISAGLTDGKSHLIPTKSDGTWADNFQCVCDASLWPFVRLVNYRKA
jgi:hypothetical protein